MGQPPRASRRRAVAVSDEEDDHETAATPDVQEPSDEEAGESKARKRHAAGKLKPIQKTAKKTQEPTPPMSTQSKSSQKSPSKTKVPKTKGASAAKETSKSNGKPITSFFNAAVLQQQQRQQPTAPSASPERPPPSQEKAEEISSDISDDGRHLRGSNTGLALRKRKGQHNQSFEARGLDASFPPPPTQKFRKVADGSRQPSVTVFNDDKRSWTEQFAPVDVSELAVHKRKVADVKGWLGDALRGRRRKVLVLKGAAGTGKTATVQLLAKEIGIEVLEWKSPAGNEYATEGSLSASSQFEEFVARAGKSTRLTFSTDANDPIDSAGDAPGERLDAGRPTPQLLLIEEFPNTFSRDSPVLLSFRSTLLQYLSAPVMPDETSTPIVLIISETLLSTSTAAADSFTSHRLLGPALSNHPFLNTIEFNAVASTILTGALNSIILKEARKSGRRRTPGPQVLKRIAEIGDIRSAISSLEFLCLRGDEDNLWSSKIAFTKPKKKPPEAPLTKAEEEALTLINTRQSSLDIFHGVGKVIYNKRIPPALGTRLPQPPSHLPHLHRSQVPETDANRLIDDLGTDTATFVASLHENYVLSTSVPNSPEETMDSLNGCLEALSDADTLSLDRFSFGTRAFSGSATDSLRQDELAFQTAVRGVLFALPNPVKRSANPGVGKDAYKIYYPSSLRLWRAREEVEGVLELLTQRAQAGTLAVAGAIEKRLDAVEGVEAWAARPNRRSEGRAARAIEADDDGEGTVSSTASRSEMLLERLPYMMHITASGAVHPMLREQIAKVTSVRAAAAISADDSADLDEQEDETQTEEWATDRPDAGSAQKKPPRSKTSSTVQDMASTSGGLKLAVDTVLQGLVLEDDDIEDF